MASKPKNNSDAILALRDVRELLLQEVVGHGHHGPDDYTRGGVMTCKQRMPVERSCPRQVLRGQDCEEDSRRIVDGHQRGVFGPSPLEIAQRSAQEASKSWRLLGKLVGYKG